MIVTSLGSATNRLQRWHVVPSFVFPDTHIGLTYDFKSSWLLSKEPV